MAEAPGTKKGKWQGKEAKDFKEFQNAIVDVLKDQAPGSKWMVGIEVERVGNPIHDYRIILTPGGG